MVHQPLEDPAMERRKLTPEEFFDGLLAAIRLQTEVIEGEPTEVHRAFNRVLKELPRSHVLDVDLFDVDYDPLYGQSGWFDRALTTAQRDAILGFANPSYKKIIIKYTTAEGNEILDSITVDGAKDEFQRLASVFTRSLAAAVPRGSSF
jgi:hypothetical protein